MSEDSTRDIRLTALADVQAKLSEVLNRVSQIEETVQERLYDTRPNFQMLSQQMEGIIERLDGMDSRFEHIEHRLEHIEQKMDVLGLDVPNTRTNLASVMRRVDQIEQH